MQVVRSKLNIFCSRLNQTCRNLTVHGPGYLARKDVHITYRIIYFIIYLHIWIVAAATIYEYYTTYQENTIRFTTRTDYLDWNTTFPSVTVCETANIDKITTLTPKFKHENSATMANFIKDIAFFSGNCLSCSSTCESTSFCQTNFTHMTSIYRSGCNELFIECTWNDKPINCCQTFKPIYTEYGACFSMNNNHNLEKFPLFTVASANRRTLGTLKVIISEDFEAFLHSHEDVPFWNMESDRRLQLQQGSYATVIYSITDVVNEPEVSLTPPEIRQCRFPAEIPPNFLGFRYYSYSVCISQCRIEAELKLCDCTDHLSPVEYKSRYCDLGGLKCLTKHYEKLRKLKVPGLNDTGLYCDCLPSCVEPDYDVVAKPFMSQKESRGGTVKFVLSNRPFERVTRQVALTTLDLVVAMGSCFGLCFGGSILSIMEVLYYLFLKRWKHK